MAVPGRKPKPTRLKLLAGNPGKRPLNNREPQPPKRKRLPSPPGHLGEIAAHEWRRTGKILQRIGLLTQIDLAALEAYCVTYERWVEAEKQVQKLGPIVKTKNGNLIQNPYLAVANRAMKELRAWLSEFGMTPSSRSRVKVNENADKDDFFGYE